jgi:hypothetical protein
MRKHTKTKVETKLYFMKNSGGEGCSLGERARCVCQDMRCTNMVIIVHKQSVTSNRSKLILQFHGPDDEVLYFHYIPESKNIK